MTVTPTVHTVSIYNRDFWKGAGERALKTFAQGIVGVPVLLTATSGTDASALPGEVLHTSTWITALTGALILAVLSLLTSIANPTFVAGENVVAKAQASAPEAYASPEGQHTGSTTASPSTDAQSSLEDAQEDLTPVVREVTVEAETPR